MTLLFLLVCAHAGPLALFLALALVGAAVSDEERSAARYRARQLREQADPDPSE
jgi:hypothetical protein